MMKTRLMLVAAVEKAGGGDLPARQLVGFLLQLLTRQIESILNDIAVITSAGNARCSSRCLCSSCRLQL